MSKSWESTRSAWAMAQNTQWLHIDCVRSSDEQRWVPEVYPASTKDRGFGASVLLYTSTKCDVLPSQHSIWLLRWLQLERSTIADNVSVCSHVFNCDSSASSHAQWFLMINCVVIWIRVNLGQSQIFCTRCKSMWHMPTPRECSSKMNWFCMCIKTSTNPSNSQNHLWCCSQIYICERLVLKIFESCAFFLLLHV